MKKMVKTTALIAAITFGLAACSQLDQLNSAMDKVQKVQHTVNQVQATANSVQALGK